MSISRIGTELKVNVHIEPIDNYHMDNYDFTCKFFTTGNCGISIPKSDMIRIDEDNYIARIDTKKVGRGNLMLRVVAQIPDNDFDDMLRKEVCVVSTGILIEL